MKTHHALKPSALAIALALGSSTLLIGCGDGDDDDGLTTNLTGLSITTSNAQDVAEFGWRSIAVFPQIGQLALSTFQSANTPTTANVTPAAVYVDDISADVCLEGGTATSTRNDADDSGTLTAGDTVNVSFNNCDAEIDGVANPISGTFDMAVVAYEADNLPYQTTLDVAMDLTGSDVIDSQTHTFAITASMRMDASTQDDLNQYTVNFTGADPSGHVTYNEDGQLVYKMGCFNIRQDFNAFNSSPGTYTLASHAVLVNGANQVLTLSSTNSGPLSFTQGNEAPTGGALDFLSYVPDTRLPCNALGIDADGVSNDGSWMRMTSNGDGFTVNLQVYDQADNPVGSPITVNWTDID